MEIFPGSYLCVDSLLSEFFLILRVGLLLDKMTEVIVGVIDGETG